MVNVTQRCNNLRCLFLALGENTIVPPTVVQAVQEPQWGKASCSPNKKTKFSRLTVPRNDPHRHNTFDDPDTVKPMDSVSVQAVNGQVTVNLQKTSVAMVEW